MVKEILEVLFVILLIVSIISGRIMLNEFIFSLWISILIAFEYVNDKIFDFYSSFSFFVLSWLGLFIIIFGLLLGIFVSENNMYVILCSVLILSIIFSLYVSYMAISSEE